MTGLAKRLDPTQEGTRHDATASLDQVLSPRRALGRADRARPVQKHSRRHRREVAGPSRARFHGQADHLPRAEALADRAAKGLQTARRQARACTSASTCPTRRTTSIAFFGVLKAGGTVVNYSPLDAAQVLELKIEDSETDILVTLDLAALYPQMAATARHDAAEEARRRRSRRMSRAPERGRGADEGGQAASRCRQRRAARRASPRLLDNDGTLPGPCDRRSARRARRAAIHRRHDRPAEGRDADPRQSVGGVRAVLRRRSTATPPVLVEGEERVLACCRCSTSTRCRSTCCSASGSAPN